METKVCRKCSVEKPTSEFHKRSRAKDGLQIWCKPCAIQERVEYAKTHKRKKRKYYNVKAQENMKKVIEYLNTHPCVDCGETDFVVLQFDHRSDKHKIIVRMVYDNYGWEKIQSEIDKCDVRCANCHTRKTAKDRNYYSYMPWTQGENIVS